MSRLRPSLCCVLLAALGGSAELAAQEEPSIDREVLDVGVFSGILNIGDFGSEWMLGLSATVQASEDFFVQFNYLSAEADLSAFEESQGSYFSGDDRDFDHYDLLLGYRLFQGELYPAEGRANLSSFYLVGGIGEIDFGGEENFSYTLGAGYETALTRDLILRIDYRNYIYESSLIRDEENSNQNGQFSAGISYLF